MRFIDWRTYEVTWFGKRTSWQLVFVSCGIAHIEDEFTYRRREIENTALPIAVYELKFPGIGLLSYDELKLAIPLLHPP